MKTFCIFVCSLAFSSLSAEISLPGLFSDNMVLQREQENPIWGYSEPDEQITVSLAGANVSTKSDKNGSWRVNLPALPAGGPHKLEVSGSSTVSISNVLVGEVWFCSGQSNMEWAVWNTYGGEVEVTAANYPEIRLMTVPKNPASEPQDEVPVQWQICSPDTVGDFSAVGYYYGQTLHAALGVPIGLIDNSWGGSSAEAWVPRKALEADERYAPLLQHWDNRVATFDVDEHEAYLEEFDAWREAGYPDPQMDWTRLMPPEKGQHRPANIFNGMVNPFAGYGIRGVIWYQGETNSGRAEQHLHLFPLLVESWRQVWKQGDFPFYWVQLADYGSESDTPGDDSWAEFRDSQTRSMDTIRNSGQAVIIDLGEGRDIHPRDKKTVASRLVRWPLANDYGFDLAYQSPRYKEMEIRDGRVRITLDHVSEGGLWSFDVEDVMGFSIAGEDQKFVWANATIIDQNTVEVWSDEIPAPVAVRYGWAINPKLNLYDRNGLPVTPFRTDNWEWLSAGNVK